MTYRLEPNPPELHEFFGADFEWLWPDEDESLAGDLPTLRDVPAEVFPHLPEVRTRTCIQAGGAIGAWPKYFAQHFEQVYTFEPYPPSFHCLTVNAPELNVHKYNAALGNEHCMVHMDFPEHRQRSATGKENIGGYRCTGPGDIPCLRIDDFAWHDDVDLLYLDLEGYELFALRGGIETIKRSRPVIVLEDKAGCCTTFGYKVGDVERYLQSEAGYRTVKRFHGGRDVLLVG